MGSKRKIRLSHEMWLGLAAFAVFVIAVVIIACIVMFGETRYIPLASGVMSGAGTVFGVLLGLAVLVHNRRSQKNAYQLEHFKRQYDGFRLFIVEGEDLVIEAESIVTECKKNEVNMKVHAGKYHGLYFKAWRHYMSEPFIVTPIRSELLAFYHACGQFELFLNEIAEEGDEQQKSAKLMNEKKDEVEKRLRHIRMTVNNLTNKCYEFLDIDSLTIGTRNLLDKLKQVDERYPWDQN